MPDADDALPAPGKLYPAAAESTNAGRPGRIRLSRALAASAKALAEAAGVAKPAKRISRCCKLALHEDAQLAALKQRAHGLGLDTKKGDLLRAGLLLLASCDDVQLRKAVARVNAGGARCAPQPAARNKEG